MTKGLLLALKKRKPAICDDMDELGGHSAKGGKPGRETNAA